MSLTGRYVDDLIETGQYYDEIESEMLDEYEAICEEEDVIIEDEDDYYSDYVLMQIRAEYEKKLEDEENYY